MREPDYKVYVEYTKQTKAVTGMSFDVMGKLKRIETGFSQYIISGDRDKFHLREYTGLKDSENKKIYEGDIVSFYHEEDKKNSKEVSVVTWFGDSDWEYPAFDIDGSKLKKHSFDGNALCEILVSGFYKCEIIGNIFENPYLLK